jgi:hypothetical protein
MVSGVEPKAGELPDTLIKICYILIDFLSSLFPSVEKVKGEGVASNQK